MHVHILGICGTFMAGIAAIAKQAGHRVTGSDRNVYPPMSTQLEALGIELTEGFAPAQLDPEPDVVVVGNVMTRGMPVIEALLDRGIPYASGPEWLAREVLADRWVLAVAGTHGKTTTTSLLAWILEYAGLSPGFLIGGIAEDFSVSARLGERPFFVIEADEYDTAFFDKRAKFVHYRPRTAILNNLEFDHADIYPDVAAIQRQFHHLVRTVPAAGRLVVNAVDPRLAETLAMGAWTPREGFARDGGGEAQWCARALPGGEDGSKFEVLESGRVLGRVDWRLLGGHNVDNALAAIAAARHAGVPPEVACAALGEFRGIKRRMELRGEARGVKVYDDFAHHPTAIATTLDGLRRRVGAARIVAVLEPRSNTMKLGVHRETLAPSLAAADEVWLYAPPDLGWDAGEIVRGLGARGHAASDVDTLARELAGRLRAGDHALIMSNGGFGGLHLKLLAALEASG
ncbi:MAG: UDP-N-acetylmuramate:L-alanyl-gamma-D-glutamyl-meso-diaminopimelate ligase [Steroidobacteraceae bacterium]|nr:UDP-N-acetylmuramate:L-alanyl-gamma-D-glutamyl-meso-diaminopimelate ligase [Nevskiaceae bacterium]MCP5338817.1 UDP-N-acetylmuramate:L-alanyl-gamma-D-glutamyl-meso-diaminopimelate ligase [Nevskiaceae bacterium]MCP5360885.1 UDP-N-acetylmuramate:L-alanyl-gamma-D-glutamyl-meso-diaminopimelate ligase [Nevskiaceae bacterium]MCP5466268.1 UDP-N-acetylmuramate:L-alanyl-gamma-D-glutamyl-meso-diaminopimelate ligase [Nevskiaceae bacterium]MCP5471670.1 UDP-N-acetylmuramate:L-alanyl-gamma-D-glutamyl-meso-